VVAAKATDAKHASALNGGAGFISRYFTLTQGSGITTINADIMLSYTAADSTDSGLVTLTNVDVAKWDGATWSFINPTRGYDATNAVYTATVAGQTSLSDWTISGPNGVPAELSRFSAEIIREK
jgi:hypothetical protein